MILLFVFDSKAVGPQVLDLLLPTDLIVLNIASGKKYEFTSYWKQLMISYYQNPNTSRTTRVVYNFKKLKQKEAACCVDKWLRYQKIMISHITILDFNYSTLILGDHIIHNFHHLVTIIFGNSFGLSNCLKNLINFVSKCCDCSLRELAFVEVGQLNDDFFGNLISKITKPHKLKKLLFYRCQSNVVGPHFLNFLLLGCGDLRVLKLILAPIPIPTTTVVCKQAISMYTLEVIKKNIYLTKLSMSEWVEEICNSAELVLLISQRQGCFAKINYSDTISYKKSIHEFVEWYSTLDML